MRKSGARLLGKLTICLDNAGPLWLRGHCIVAIFAVYNRFLDNDNIKFGFCSNFTTFQFTFQNVAKTFKIVAKPNNILIL